MTEITTAMAAESAQNSLAATHPVPSDADGPVFAEPWQARAFASTLELHQRGVFSWPEWAAALGRTIRDAKAQGDPDLGDTYWDHWLATLEGMIAEKGVASAAALADKRAAWERAAEATPHGQPIRLDGREG